MSEQPRLTVTLPHDQWQWVMSLVLGSQYIRAKPIVEAVEAAAKQAADARHFEANGLKTQVDHAHAVIRRHEIEISSLHEELKQRHGKIKHLEARIRGYQSKAAQVRRAAEQATKANGAAEPEPEPEAIPPPLMKLSWAQRYSPNIADALWDANIRSNIALAKLTDAELLAIRGIGSVALRCIREQIPNPQPLPFPATEPGESFVDKVLEAASVLPDEDEP